MGHEAMMDANLPTLKGRVFVVIFGDAFVFQRLCFAVQSAEHVEVWSALANYLPRACPDKFSEDQILARQRLQVEEQQQQGRGKRRKGGGGGRGDGAEAEEEEEEEQEEEEEEEEEEDDDDDDDGDDDDEIGAEEVERDHFYPTRKA